MKDTYKFYNLEKKEENLEKIENIRSQIDENDPHIISHSESSLIFCYKKRIKGNIFSISNDNIENISITFVKISGFYERFQKRVNTGFTILLLLIFTFSICYAIWDFHFIKFTSTLDRIIFCVTTIFSSTLALLFIKNLLDFAKLKTDIKKYFIEFKDSLVIWGFFSLPYLYLFEKVNANNLLITSIVYLFVMGILLTKKKE